MKNNSLTEQLKLQEQEIQFNVGDTKNNIDRKKVNNQVLYADINNTIIQDNSFIYSISLETSFPPSFKEKNPKPRKRKKI